MSYKLILANILAIGSLLALIIQQIHNPVSAALTPGQTSYECLPDYLTLIVPVLALGVTLGAIACAAGRALRDKSRDDDK